MGSIRTILSSGSETGNHKYGVCRIYFPAPATYRSYSRPEPRAGVEPMAEEFDTNEGLTRREALKRGAMLGGALVWAVPVVQTVGMSAAMAAPGSPELLFFDDFSDEARRPLVTPASRTGRCPAARWTFSAIRRVTALPHLSNQYRRPRRHVLPSRRGVVATKTTFPLPPGTYRLSFDIAGNHRGGPADSVTVSLGAVFSELFTRNSGDALAMIQRDIVVGSDTSGKIVFDHAGGDNIGILLNSVKLERIA